jgi:hypothetical protein
MPPAVELETLFGRYHMACDYDDKSRKIRCKRELTMKSIEIPVKDYASVREFFETIRKTEQTPVVLGR